MSLDKIFGLYTISFLAVTILIGIGELAFGLPNRWIGWIFMALSLVIYIVIGVVTRTSNPDQYYVAGRGVPAFYNGMATGSDWMSAASFISRCSSGPTCASSAPTRSRTSSAPATAAPRPASSAWSRPSPAPSPT
jgi:hypothetical protein